MNADSNSQNLSLFSGLFQGLQSTAVKYAVVFRTSNIVEEDQIDPVCPEAAKAALQFIANPKAISFIYFCGEIELFAPSFQRKANLLFAVTIAVSGVHKVNSPIDSLIEEDFGFFLGDPGEFDGPEADHR